MLRQRFFGIALLVSALLLASATAAQAAISYSGSIDNGGVGDLVAGGNWNVGAPQPTSLSWVVTDLETGYYSYLYTFTHPEGETSHIVFEVSANITSTNEFLNVSGGAATLSLGGGDSNPDIPGSFTNQVKFDNTTGTTTTIYFEIARLPVWGDFYSKDGTAGGFGNNTAWNSGFTASDVDPLNAPSNGSLLGHLLVPDSVVPPVGGPLVPEPASLVIWSLLSLVGLFYGARRKT